MEHLIFFLIFKQHNNDEIARVHKYYFQSNSYLNTMDGHNL